jgi:hypothetical protein
MCEKAENSRRNLVFREASVFGEAPHAKVLKFFAPQRYLNSLIVPIGWVSRQLVSCACAGDSFSDEAAAVFAGEESAAKSQQGPAAARFIGNTCNDIPNT